MSYRKNISSSLKERVYKVNKKELFKIMSNEKAEQLMSVSKMLMGIYQIKSVKPPKKSLVMLKAKDMVKKTPFYLGEVLACECVIDFEGVRGYALTMGDDFDKVEAMAIIDGALNKGINEAKEIISFIEDLGLEQEKAREDLNGKILSSKVSFDVMEV